MLKPFRQPIFQPLFVSFVSLALCVALSSCGKKKKDDPNAVSNAGSPATAAPSIPGSDETVCNTVSAEATALSYYDHRLRNAAVREGQISGTWQRDSYICGQLEGEDNRDKPELALVVGNLGTNREFARLIRPLASQWISAAARTHRHACVYVASAENIEMLSAKTNVERVVFIGRGNNGGLLSTFEGDTIRPRDVSTFASGSLKEVTFLSTQTRSRAEEWQRVFGRSRDVRVNMRLADRTIDRSVREVSEMAAKLVACQL